MQPVLDNRARREISRSAAESTLMIAVSPLALVDMAFIAWRNIRLISRIAAFVRHRAGLLQPHSSCSGWVLLNIAFAGASGAGARSGHGLDVAGSGGAAVRRARRRQSAPALTARLGIKAMELCRPLPWLEGKSRSLAISAAS
ncbi:DUF697 domain-containing protein [Serratia ureilytica]